MKRFLLSATVLLAMVGPVRADGPKLSKERVVFNTPAGDIVFVLYPEVAPEHVKQFIKLVENGVYDHMHFCRIEPGFVLQITEALFDRLIPLDEKQKALIHPLKAEFSTLKHRRGILSMAHRDNQPDSGETSFSILLGDAPHLDGKYTIFGHVEMGMDVVEEMCRVPRSGNQPTHALEVRKAIVLESADQLHMLNLVKAHPVDVSSLRVVQTQSAAEPPASNSGLTIPPAIGGGLLLMIGVALACYFLSNRLPRHILISLLLINVLIGGFLTLIVVTPLAHTSKLLSVAAFAGILGMLKLMSRFENPA